MVRADLVPDNNLIAGEAITLRCAHRDTVLYPLADVTMDVGGVAIQVRAAVSDTLPVSVLLGTDVCELGRLLRENPSSTHTPGVGEARCKRQMSPYRKREDWQMGHQNPLRPQSILGRKDSYIDRPRIQSAKKKV